MRVLHRTVMGLTATLVAFGITAGAARAEEDNGPAADGAAPAAQTTWFDLRVALGDTAQDEVPHYGLQPSIVVGHRAALRRGVSVEVAVAAAKISAVWENIGGIATGYLGVRRDRDRTWIAIGTTVPLDWSMPAADCFPTPMRSEDSLTYSFGADTSCWDRSAYRRAALQRGAWNAWMWAPDWVTPSVRGGASWPIAGGWEAVVEGGLGVGRGIGDAQAGRKAVVTQAAVEARHVTPGYQLGARLQAAGVFLDDTSPFILSAEAFARWRHGRYALEARGTLPFQDLRNDDVSPGFGGYRIVEQWSLGLGGAIAY